MASSDATNIQTSIRLSEDKKEAIINGHKWWISGAGDPRCKVHLLMGKSDPTNPNPHKQQTIVIIPANTKGVNIIRPMRVMNWDDAPEGHCEIMCVPKREVDSERVESLTPSVALRPRPPPPATITSAFPCPTSSGTGARALRLSRVVLAQAGSITACGPLVRPLAHST